ncbi:MAG: questin oxidase family protein [Sciscionella sp.]
MTDSAVVDQLLNDRTYHIEFNGHLTNHAKHAVVALAGLGVAPQKIKTYYDNYAKMTSYGYGLEAPRPSKHDITEDNWKQFLGKRTSFSAYCDFFDRQEQKLGLEEVLKRYVQPLLPGWVGSFTHATIHLGWALDVNSRWMAIEGIAYLAFSYVSCHPERSIPAGDDRTGERSVVDSLLHVAGVWQDNHDALRHWVQELLANTEAGTAAGIHPELARSGLQYRIARLLEEGHPLIYAMPAWIEGQEVSASWEQLYYAVTLLYLAVPGDFVLLHLVTSLHAMEQIAKHLPADQQQDVVKAFWIGTLCIVFSGADFPTRTKLAALHSAFHTATDAGNPAVDQDWEHIVARAVEEDEEHNPKLVYVLRRVWERTGRQSIYRCAAGQFTATPELPPSFEEPPTEELRAGEESNHVDRNDSIDRKIPRQ